ncbi:MAG TPA: asparagine synthase (glutamine-hydrolyzing) [Longimicrobiales bacterium]|nr:asparagine synthase (glutamine-hydrolyzing) [Longimicrobiales bacterium]
MCGICGFKGFRDDTLLAEMTESLHHRGPDAAGDLITNEASLGHRRLSIIDLEGGRQPITNEDGTIAIICNGEIYNYRELRAELIGRGHRFQTHSDTEVIVHLYEDYGPGCVDKLIGMFAFALWDGPRNLMLVARDRIGIKPLYYLEHGGRFLFASELKSLLAYRGVDPAVDSAAVHRYLALRYSPGPGTMFDRIHKFPAGTLAVVRNGGVEFTRYWEPQLWDGPFDRSDQDYLDEFAERFERSIRRRLISDVPLGAYLSGGLDSSVIVAAMSKLTSEPVRTFTVGFDYAHDELGEAAKTAKLLGCRHTEIPCGVSDIEHLPRIVWHLDEPLGDAIVIPMYLLAREAKKQVTVVLTGEGADETLGGYLFHRALAMGNRLSRAVPRAVRSAIMLPALRATPAAALNLAFDYPANLGDRGKLKVIDFARLLDEEHLPAAYLHLISLFDHRDTSSLYSDDFARSLNGESLSVATVGGDNAAAPFLNRALHLQFDHWLPDDILMKQDKMSMASGIEGRVPFLDHELVEFSLRIPPHMKIRRKRSKHILRSYAERLLPPATTSRGKKPFYAPFEKYLEHPVFLEILDDTLSEKTVRERGLFRPEAVAALRDATRAGDFVHAKQVFSLVVLELWFRMAVDRRGRQ